VQALPLNTFNYKFIVSYDGTLFEGWQIQKAHQRTVQGEINKALKKISKSDNVLTLGSGRTDSGVHALTQVVKCTMTLDIEPDALKRALNSHLPEEIRVMECDHCSADFHPVRDAKWKTYQYIFYEGEVLPPHHRHLMTHLDRPVDWDKASEALELFRGRHDFINYSTKGTEVKSTVREIFDVSLQISQFDPIYHKESSGRVIKLSVTGNGFLKQMVRLIVGTVIAAANDKVGHQQILTSFKGELDRKLGAVAAPQGLYLMHVEYDKHYVSAN
jgi:tRNA pseudouridine38-40 synthase